MPLNLRTHETRVDKDGRRRITRVNHHVRLKQGNEPAVFIQGGAYYAENGEEYKTPPAWVREHVERLSPETLNLVGLRPPTDAKLK